MLSSCSTKFCPPFPERSSSNHFPAASPASMKYVDSFLPCPGASCVPSEFFRPHRLANMTGQCNPEEGKLRSYCLGPYKMQKVGTQAGTAYFDLFGSSMLRPSSFHTHSTVGFPMLFPKQMCVLSTARMLQPAFEPLLFGRCLRKKMATNTTHVRSLPCLFCEIF